MRRNAGFESTIVAAFIIAAASARSAPITIAGGELDPTITNANVYLAAPTSARVSPGVACRLTKSYVEHVRVGQFTAVAALFAEDAVVLEPAGGTLRGREEIGKFYTGTIGKMRPDIIDAAYTGNGTDCMVVLAVRVNIAGQPRYKLVTLNAAGQFSRMVAFARPSAAAK
jgi:steroid Delta-isomerase